jgi:hypothetical protein
VVAALGLAVANRILGATTPAALVIARWLQPPGAVAAVGSLAMPEGTAAGAVAGIWAAVCLCTAAAGAVLLGRVVSGAALDVEVVRWPLALVTLAVATVHLAAGGVWLVVGRLGLHPFDMSTGMVRTSAVHFHYAGFGLALLAATGLACADWMASRVALSIGSLTAIVGPLLVAAGIATDSGGVEIGGTAVVAVAAWTVAFGTFLLATSTEASTAAPATVDGMLQAVGRALLVASALSSVVPMVLALQWALARHSELPALSRADMAATHGVLIGLGFVVAGLAGWLMAGVSSPETHPALAPSDTTGTEP